MINEFRDYKTYIFVGHFGSGKTEVAANFALELAKHSDKINIIDMDIVNPFFRTVDFRNYFNAVGIKVIASKYAGSNLDMPAIPQNIPLVLSELDSRTILDVGGDETGARILSTYSEDILMQNYRAYCVVNIRRPGTNSPEKIKLMLQQIQASSKIKISALVNNTNLSHETTVMDVVQGQEMLEPVAFELGIPIAFICTNENIVNELPKSIIGNKLIHKIKVGLPWE